MKLDAIQHKPDS